MKHTILFLLIIAGMSIAVTAQQPAFYNDIMNFKKQDSLHFPAKHAILFVGSSSFTKWTDVQAYFPGYPIINRGFGGSSLPDVIRYADQIIYPYQPRQVVIYCGENDLAASDTVSAATVIMRVQTLFSLIRAKLPEAGIVFVSLKPSPSRRRLFPKMLEVNARVKSFLSGQRNTAFVDVYSKMLDANQQPVKELFLSDSLHMTANGYAIWQKAIQPVLIK